MLGMIWKNLIETSLCRSQAQDQIPEYLQDVSTRLMHIAGHCQEDIGYVPSQDI